MAVGHEPIGERAAGVRRFRRPVEPRILAGLAALGAVAILIGGAFAGMVGEAMRDWSGAISAFDAYMWRVARFTLWQAALSTILAIVPALIAARALSRHPRFPGRTLILGSSPFRLPCRLSSPRSACWRSMAAPAISPIC